LPKCYLKNCRSVCENEINIFRNQISFELLNVQKGTYLIDIINLQKTIKKITNNRNILIKRLSEKIDKQNIPKIEDKIRHFLINGNVQNSRDSLNYYRDLYQKKTVLYDKWTEELLENKDVYMGYFETEAQLRGSTRIAKDFIDGKNTVCALIAEFDIKYTIKKKLMERSKISNSNISLEDLEKYYKNSKQKRPKEVNKILDIFEDIKCK